jgi:hypothetical protein
MILHRAPISIFQPSRAYTFASHTMLAFTDLPAELRQRTISLNFPTLVVLENVYHVKSVLPFNPAVIFTAEALKPWSPIHYVFHPKKLHRLSSPYIDHPDQYWQLNSHSVTIGISTHSPRLRHICIDIFHDSDHDSIT